MKRLTPRSFAIAAFFLVAAVAVKAETLEVEALILDDRDDFTVGTVEVKLSVQPGDLVLVRSLEVPGRAVFEVPADAVVRVGVDGGGFWAPAEVVHVTSASSVSLRLRPTGWLTGTLLLPKGEAPPGEIEARVRAAETSEDLPESLWRCPVVEGAFRCEVPRGVLDVRLRAKSYVSHYLWNVEVPSHGTLPVGGLKLRAGASVVGWVEAPRRDFRFEEVAVRLQPLFGTFPGNAVDLHRATSLDQETTANRRGFFELTGMPPGSYALVVEHPEYAPARITPVPVHERAETEIHRVVLERPVRFEARLDPPTPPYRRRWQVELLQHGEVPGHLETVAEGPASEDGSWHAERLAPGEYLLQVGDESGSRWTSQDVRLADGLPPVEVLLPYVRLEGTLRLGGEPLAASLYFGGRFGARRVAIRSDEEGKFYVVLPEQDKPWTVEIVAAAIGLEALVAGVEARKTPGEPWAKTEIDLPDGRVAGIVIDEAGAPVPEVLVEAVAADDRSRPVSARSSPRDGTFELRALDEGRYYLEALHVRQGQQLSAEPVLVEVAADQPSDGIRIVLREDFPLSGQVISPTGQGVPAAKVLAMLDRSDGPLHGVSPSAATDLDGGFELSLPRGAGQVVVSVLAPGFTIESRVVDARRTEWLPIELDPTGGTLVVTYDGGDGAEPRLLRFRTAVFHPHLLAPSAVLVQWAELHRAGNDEDAARFVIPMLEPGFYTVCYEVGFAVVSTGRLPPGGLPDRCASGVLAPHGELHLMVPVPATAREPAAE